MLQLWAGILMTQHLELSDPCLMFDRAYTFFTFTHEARTQFNQDLHAHYARLVQTISEVIAGYRINGGDFSERSERDMYHPLNVAFKNVRRINNYAGNLAEVFNEYQKYEAATNQILKAANHFF
jgi:hypothetical protein